VCDVVGVHELRDGERAPEQPRRGGALARPVRPGHDDDERSVHEDEHCIATVAAVETERLSRGAWSRFRVAARITPTPETVELSEDTSRGRPVEGESS
jgi:hypothetical protein